MELHSQTCGRLVCFSHSSMLQQNANSLVGFCLLNRLLSLVSLTQVTEISMGEFLLHSSVVWLNPHPSLGRMRKDPEMTVFGESAHSSYHDCCCILGILFSHIFLLTPQPRHVFGNRCLGCNSFKSAHTVSLQRL